MLLAATREFFCQRSILEVETPILSSSGNTDPNIQSFTTSTNTPLYLRTSPEFPLKRLLAAGYGDCYELGRVFRQGELGQFHNPEFTLLEWYRLGWDWRQLATEVCELIHQLGGDRISKYPLRWVSYTNLFIETTGLNPLTATIEQLNQLADQRQINPQSQLQTNELLDLIMTLIIQPKLPASQLTIIHHFPISQAALAMENPENPETALRFEVYLGQHELANGYQELTDAGELEKRMQAENQQRLATNLPVLPVDNNLLTAQQQGLPQCSGVALGFDRLVMAISAAESITDCLAFDFNRA